MWHLNYEPKWTFRLPYPSPWTIATSANSRRPTMCTMYVRWYVFQCNEGSSTFPDFPLMDLNYLEFWLATETVKCTRISWWVSLPYCWTYEVASSQLLKKKFGGNCLYWIIKNWGVRGWIWFFLPCDGERVELLLLELDSRFDTSSSSHSSTSNSLSYCVLSIWKSLSFWNNARTASA